MWGGAMDGDHGAYAFSMCGGGAGRGGTVDRSFRGLRETPVYAAACRLLCPSSPSFSFRYCVLIALPGRYGRLLPADLQRRSLGCDVALH